MTSGHAFDPAASIEPPASFEPLRRRIDSTLHDFLVQQCSATATVDAEATALLGEVDRVVQSGGKRLRPAFCVLGHVAAGGDQDDRIFKAAAAIELLHTFALIHDDVMDEANERRGAPSSRVRLTALRREGGRPEDADRFGLAGAILAGDLAVVLADQLLLDSGFPPDRLAAGLHRYHRMRMEAAVGQFLDLWGAGIEVGPERARRIASLKSGSYTVEGPLEIGASLAGASLEVMATLSRYGAPLGEAFQIRDDLDSALEARAGQDLAQGTPTVLLALARQGADADDARFLRDCVGRSTEDPDDVERLRQVLHRSGGVAAAVALVNKLVARARAGLDARILDPEAVSALDDLAAAMALAEA